MLCFSFHCGKLTMQCCQNHFMASFDSTLARVTPVVQELC